MNKTLMLVICDFLLLSMLALARFDPPEETPTTTLDATASSATAEEELIELLQESLESEQSSRETLSSDLTETRENLQQQARLLAEREAALAKTATDLATTQENLKTKAAEAASLSAKNEQIEASRSELEKERTQLAKRFEATRTELEAASKDRIQLTNAVGQLKEARSVSEERLQQTADALKQREIELAMREAELKAAEAEKQQLAAERERLNRQLEVANAEKQLLANNLDQQQAEKELLRQEKEAAFARADRLTENVSELGQGLTELGSGVSTLAESSEAIREEIEASRPHTTSEIFTRFQNNRATIRFTATEKTIFGTSERSYESKSILITDETDTTYLVTHASNTPFTLAKTAKIEAADLSVSLGQATLPITQIGFLATDPRIVFIPLPKSLVENSGLESFELARQPERWEEAVLVKSDESNFGSTQFRRITTSAQFLKMERPALGELFADFASSRGDLAFTKNNQIIGLLTNKRHAVVIDDFVAAAIINLGSNFSQTKALVTLDSMRRRLQTLPAQVQ